VTPPARDDPAEQNLPRFINRLYDFYRIPSLVLIRLDPRRHPPELYGDQFSSNPDNSIIRYLAHLQFTQAKKTYPIGQGWVPVDTAYKPSRGLVVLLTYDYLLGGQGLNARTMVASSLVTTTQRNQAEQVVGVDTPDATNPLVLVRTPRDLQGISDHDRDRIVSTIAHEVGHTFNLDDEYEELGGAADPDDAVNFLGDLEPDNLTRLGFLKLGNPPQDRTIDPAKIKWFALPLMEASGRLVAPSVAKATPRGIEVTVGPAAINPWVELAKRNPPVQVALRNFNVDTQNKRQLPWSRDPGQILTGLTISGKPDVKRGSFVLTGVPAGNIPVFAKGSLVFVQAKDRGGDPAFAVRKDVRAFLVDPANPRGRRPLNNDPDIVNPKQAQLDDPTRDADEPIADPRFQRPAPDTFRLVGVFEGGNRWSRGYYRPAGACKMRSQFSADEHGQFCFVCKWLIVNLVDPAKHAELHRNFYPGGMP
jgi:hypothetical protein